MAALKVEWGRTITGIRAALAARAASARALDRGSLLASASEGGLITLYLPGVDRPLFARPRSSDLLAFKQIADGGYALRLPFEPRLVLDLGANVGYASVDLALRYPQANVIAVEPEPTNVALLRRNIAAYRRIEVIAGGVWPSTGSLVLEDAGIGKWGYQVRAVPGGGDVRAVTVDDLLRQAGANGADLVKIDIEGSEVELFSENTGWVGRTRAIAIELHDRFRPGCREALDAAVARSGVSFAESRHGETVVLLRTDATG